MKRLLTPPSTTSHDGLVVEPPPSHLDISRKRIRLSRLSLEGRVDWILDLHVPPGGTVTCVPGSSGGNLRVEELQDLAVDSATPVPLTVKHETINQHPLSPATQSSDDSSSSTPSCRVPTSTTVTSATVASDILQSLTSAIPTTTSISSQQEAPQRLPTHVNAVKAPSERAVIVVSAPPPAQRLLNPEVGPDADISAQPPLMRSRPQISIGRTETRPHIKTLPIEATRSMPPSRFELTAKYTPAVGRLGHTGTTIKAPRQSANVDTAPKSRVHFTANGSIPFCRMPQCGRAMYFYKNEDRWRCNLNRGGCGAVFHNVNQDIGPCSKCQRPVSDGEPCYDWCVCRYCTSSKRQGTHALVPKTEPPQAGCFEATTPSTTTPLPNSLVYAPGQVRASSMPPPTASEDGSKKVLTPAVSGLGDLVAHDQGTQSPADDSPLIKSEAIDADEEVPSRESSSASTRVPSSPMEQQLPELLGAKSITSTS